MKKEIKDFMLLDGQTGSTRSDMYLVITTAIWMNKTTEQSRKARNVPFGVLGVMLPYKIVRSTHFSDFCVKSSKKCSSKSRKFFFQSKLEDGYLLYH